MDRIVDEIVLFGLGLPLLLLAPAAPAAVAAPLLALIATGALELLDRGEGGAQRQAPASAASPVRAARFIRVARPAIAAAYLIAALAAPALAAFVPLLAYAAVAQNLGPCAFYGPRPSWEPQCPEAARWRQPPFCWERSPAWPPGARPKFKPSAPRSANGATPCRKTASRWPSEPATSPSGKIWK